MIQVLLRAKTNTPIYKRDWDGKDSHAGYQATVSLL